MDTKFQESRDAMRAERFGSSKDHFVAGVKGLGMGLVGGLTSIVTQPIEGAHNSGVSVSALSHVIHVSFSISSAWDKTAILERKPVPTGTRGTKNLLILPTSLLCLSSPSVFFFFTPAWRSCFVPFE